MQTTLTNIWHNPQNLIVKELDHVASKITMDKEEDYNRILEYLTTEFEATNYDIGLYQGDTFLCSI